MKIIKHLLLLVWMIIALPMISLAGDLFYVIHIKGSVTHEKTGKILKVGDQINSEDKIKFGANDGLMVIMGAKGKYTLSPAAKTNGTSELVYLVNNSILPLKSNGHLSTRGTENEAVMDLKNYFGNGKFFIVGNRLDIALDSTKYPANDHQFLIYRYVHGGTVVSKRIENRSGHMILDKNALYKLNGAFIEPSKIESADIYFYNSNTKSSKKIVSFSLHFIEEEQLKQELKVQKKLLREQKLSEEEINRQLLTFVTDVYGKTDQPALQQWVQTHLNEE